MQLVHFSPKPPQDLRRRKFWYGPFLFLRRCDIDKSLHDTQEIMTKLREKAHASLQAFKEGRGSPLVRSVTLSDTDGSLEDDELSMFGGRTRLVGKGSVPTRPSTPVLIQQSPTSHQPVIPCPLQQIDEHVHPSVLDYLRTFGPTRSPQVPSHVPAAPSRANSMLLSTPPLTDTTALFDISASYPSPPGSSTLSSAPQTPLPHGLSENALDMSVFPTYFPAFDYGGSGGIGALCSPIHLGTQIPEEHCVRNTTPEATMQNSWEDFITQFGLY